MTKLTIMTVLVSSVRSGSPGRLDCSQQFVKSDENEQKRTEKTELTVLLLVLMSGLAVNSLLFCQFLSKPSVSSLSALSVTFSQN